MIAQPFALLVGDAAGKVAVRVGVQAVQERRVLHGDVAGAAPDVTPGVLGVDDGDPVEHDVVQALREVLAVDADGAGVLTVIFGVAWPHATEADPLNEHVVTAGVVARPGVDDDLAVGAVAGLLDRDARIGRGEAVDGEKGLTDPDVGLDHDRAADLELDPPRGGVVVGGVAVFDAVAERTRAGVLERGHGAELAAFAEGALGAVALERRLARRRVVVIVVVPSVVVVVTSVVVVVVVTRWCVVIVVVG